LLYSIDRIGRNLALPLRQGLAVIDLLAMN
jgi:hypothetical protein